MNIWKKATAAFLCAVLVSSSFAGCGGGKTATVKSTSTAASTENASESSAKTTTNEGATNLNTWLLENSVLGKNSRTNEPERTLQANRDRVNDHLLEGYLSYTLESGRTCKMYIGKHSALRAYITVVAVPDGVTDTYQFLKEQGWIELADTYGEIIFALEPQNGKWKTPDEEASYLADCLAEPVANDAYGLREKTNGGIVTSGAFPIKDGEKTYEIAAFSGHSCNYYVGYGEGCAPLEAWTSNNPCMVIAQAFIGGESAGKEILRASASRQYNGINNGGSYPGFDDYTFQKDLIRLKDEGEIESADFICNEDIPVPTLFAGYAESDASVDYWKSVNDVEERSVDGMYYQKADSDAWQTEYNNEIVKNMGSSTGISTVKLVKDSEIPASDIRQYLSMYTRYTPVFAYSNTLGLRTDYYAVTHKAREAAESGDAIYTVSYDAVEGEKSKVEIRALQSGRLGVPFLGDYNAGNIYSCVTAFNDYDGNGTLDPRECLIYVPDSAKKKATKDGVPVVIICPGSTQGSNTFFDCTYWWNIANEEGCVFAILGQFCNTSASVLSYGDTNDSANFCRSTLAVLNDQISELEGITIDNTRIYGSGHSAGCRLIQTLTHTTESGYFAAVGSTSFVNSEFDFENGMPSYLSVGKSDISESTSGSLSCDLVKDPWIVTDDSAIYSWITNCLKDNGVKISFTADDHDSFVKTCLSYNETGRYFTYTWADANADVPIVRFNRTIIREHNCIPEEFKLSWDFISKYRLKDKKRYYSESGFSNSKDAIQIDIDKNKIQ